MSNARLFFAIALLLSGQRLTLKAQSSPWSHFTLAQGGPVRWGQTVVYDPGSNSLILFGDFIGSPCCTSLNNTWVLRNANGLGGVPQEWQQIFPTGTLPPGRINQSAVYDQAHNRMIIFGGGQANNYEYPVRFHDVWVLSNANGLGGTPNWTKLNPLAPGGLPAPREGPEAVYDPNTNRMTIFGGGNNGIMDVPNDVWVLTNANGLGGKAQWIQLSPAGNLPARREQFAATYDPASNVMTIFGGCCGSLNDVWVLSHANGLGGAPGWQQVSPAGTPPAPRGTYDEFGYDPSTNTLIVFGGLGFNPEGTEYNDTWLLTNEDNIGGTPAWVNTIPDGSSTSPPPSTPSGAYDAVSKRLMILPDPTDLWVMTTRNGIDISCSAGVPTSTQLAQLQQSGIQYAAVEAAQQDSGECPSGQIGTAQEQLDAFAGAGFKTAAYCFLYFSASEGTGTQQAQNCLNTIQTSRLSTIAFIALDVEGSSSLSHSAARNIISEAAQAVLAAGQRPVIYTSTAWERITGNPNPNPFGSYPLWITGGSFRDARGRLNCGDGVPSLTPSTATFGGWTTLSGKQYDFGVVKNGECVSPALAGVTVDFDVFDPALFQ